MDADVKRPVASMITIVAEGDVVVFGPHDHYTENVNNGKWIPMCRRKGVLVVQLDAQECSRTTQSVTE